eukprot:7657650-Pyramimonas_sp.AAC.3
MPLSARHDACRAMHPRQCERQRQHAARTASQRAHAPSRARYNSEAASSECHISVPTTKSRNVSGNIPSLPAP